MDDAMDRSGRGVRHGRRRMRRRTAASVAVGACLAGLVTGAGAVPSGDVPRPVAGDRVGAAHASRAERAPVAPSRRIWRPGPATTFQWQLTTPVDQSVPARLYDIDLFENDATVVASLRARGRRVVCYLSAGTFEDWRPDAAAFPADVLGKPLEDWPGERWLDIRRLDVLGPILARRLDLCRRKGFDGVEPDNVDAYANDSGFPLTARDQLRFNRFVARAAHARGLSVGLKNDLGQVRALEPQFDWALVEECFQYRECARMRPFVRAGKAVFVTEYRQSPRAFCAAARHAGLMAMVKRYRLDAWRASCW